jgi:hypothetical protein
MKNGRAVRMMSKKGTVLQLPAVSAQSMEQEQNGAEEQKEG